MGLSLQWWTRRDSKKTYAYISFAIVSTVIAIVVKAIMGKSHKSDKKNS